MRGWSVMRLNYLLYFLVLINCSRESLPGYKNIKSTEVKVEDSIETDEVSTSESESADAGAVVSSEDSSQESPQEETPSVEEEAAGSNLSEMEFEGDPNSTLTFDDVQDLFITNPAAGLAGCTASGCHGPERDDRGVGASSDLSSYEAIVDVEEGQSGLLIMYLTRGGMPKDAPYAVEDIQKIADWVAAGMPPGAPPVEDPAANQVVTADIVALFAADKGNCSAAGCHGGTVNPNLLGDLKVNAPAALDRLDRYAAGDANPMPQAGTGIDLLPAEVEMLRTWIAAGMPD